MSEIDRLYAYKTLLSGRRAVPRSKILSRMEIWLATLHSTKTKKWTQCGMCKPPAHGDGVEILLELFEHATLDQNATFEFIPNHHWCHQGQGACLSGQ